MPLRIWHFFFFGGGKPKVEKLMILRLFFFGGIQFDHLKNAVGGFKSVFWVFQGRDSK